MVLWYGIHCLVLNAHRMLSTRFGRGKSVHINLSCTYIHVYPCLLGCYFTFLFKYLKHIVTSQDIDSHILCSNTSPLMHSLRYLRSSNPFPSPQCWRDPPTHACIWCTFVHPSKILKQVANLPYVWMFVQIVTIPKSKDHDTMISSKALIGDDHEDSLETPILKVSKREILI